MSIRSKLILTFLIIVGLLIVQATVSYISVTSLNNNVDAMQIQSDIRDTTLDISTNVQFEQLSVEKWVSGSETGQRELFNSTVEKTESSLVEMKQLIEDLKQYEKLTEEINFNSVNTYVQNFELSREQYLQLVWDEIHAIPTLAILEQLKQHAHELIQSSLNVTKLAGLSIANDDPSYLDQVLISGSEPSVLNHVNHHQDQLNRSIIAISFTRIQSFQGVIQNNINQTLFNELYTIFNTDLASKTQDIGPLSTYIHDVVTNNDLSTLPAQDYNNLVGNYSLLGDLIDQATVFAQHFISESDRLYDVMTSKSIISASISRGMTTQLVSIRDWIDEGMEVLSLQISDAAQSQLDLVIMVIIMSLILTMALSVNVNTQISKPIRNITKWSEYISEGDLSRTQTKMKRNDEIGQLSSNFKVMNKNLRNIVHEIQKSSNLISNTAEDLASGTQEINATAEEVSAIAQTMAKGSTEQAEIITTIVQELHQSTEIVNNVSSQITKNLGIIRELSEQTNILALNTAIEAANAGEYARGFEVIAENIRKMSEQTKKTSQLVSKSSQEILEELQISFRHISEMIENVAAVSEETAASAEEVAASAEEMTASMETISANSAILSEQSRESLDVVKKFKLE